MLKPDIRIFVIIAVILAVVSIANAHEAHNKNSANTSASLPSNAEPQTPANVAAPTAPSIDREAVVDENVAEFPTFHPLVVHFPIVLIIIAAVFQIISLFVFRREFGWAVIFLAMFGAVGAYLASNVFHPHTFELGENARRLLAEHELYADITFWLAAGGFLAKVISSFVLKRQLWSEIIVTLALVGASVVVAIAGHHGAELVHKEGIGPKGKFLEMHDH